MRNPSRDYINDSLDKYLTYEKYHCLIHIISLVNVRFFVSNQFYQLLLLLYKTLAYK